MEKAINEIIDIINKKIDSNEYIVTQGYYLTNKPRTKKHFYDEVFDSKYSIDLRNIKREAKERFENWKTEFNNKRRKIPYNDLKNEYLDIIETKITADNIYRGEHSEDGNETIEKVFYQEEKKQKNTHFNNTYSFDHLNTDLNQNIIIWDSQRLLIELLGDIYFYLWIKNKGQSLIEEPEYFTKLFINKKGIYYTIKGIKELAINNDHEIFGAIIAIKEETRILGNYSEKVLFERFSERFSITHSSVRGYPEKNKSPMYLNGYNVMLEYIKNNPPPREIIESKLRVN